MAWITRDWKTILTSMSALHILTPLLMNYVPESPRWLLTSTTKAKREEAKEILENASKMNGTWNDESEAKLNALINDDEMSKGKQNTEKLKFFGRYALFL